VALVRKQSRVPFHQALIEKDCTSCHSDHLVASPGQETPRRFHHSLLKPELRSQCQSCHTAPKDALHTALRPASCSTCHSTAGWKPSSFDHSKYFPLTGDHNVGCVSCHVGGNFKHYALAVAQELVIDEIKTVGSDNITFQAFMYMQGVPLIGSSFRRLQTTT
jgi:hypothetical protein